MGWYRQRGGFRGDLVGGVYGTDDFKGRGLPSQHEVHERVREDSQEVMYWRQTASGWVLGLALDWQGKGFGEYLYAAPHPPTGFPSESVDGWGGLYDTPPDWA